MTPLRRQTTHSRSTTSDLQALLGEEHARLTRRVEQLLSAFEDGDRAEASTLWDGFEAELEAHLGLEERLILPEFAKVDAAEAAALIREHDAIRDTLAELGVGVDLHATNASAVQRFVQMLEAHAKREDALMYRWADSSLRPELRATIRAELGAAVDPPPKAASPPIKPSASS